MTVRPATPADVDVLAEVAAATFALACPPSTTEEAKAHFIAHSLSPAAFERYLADPARRLFLAEEGEANGYAMLVVAEPADAGVAAQLSIRPTAELSKIYVLETGHGRGTAAALLDRSLDAARDAGAAGVWLGTNELNHRAQRFYAKHGFTAVGTKTFRLGDVDEHDLVFERPL